MNRKVLVALGGNAILKYREKGTAEEQLGNVERTCEHLVRLIEDGYMIAITHGNGPQVGDILLKNEYSRDILPPMPLDFCGAQSQGMIGYMLQQSMRNEMSKAGLETPVVSLVTQTLVDRKDVAFDNPTKPVGSFYNRSAAEELRKGKEGWRMVEDSGRGYRRVVPSPEPREIVEKDAITTLFDAGVIVIAVGGGGVPVVQNEDGGLMGVEAVIDKDLGAQILANHIGADLLLLLTDVEKVSLNYGKPNQIDLDQMTVGDAVRYLKEGHFAPGSMAPKIEASIRFLKSKGERAVISSLEKARDALEGRAGTAITH
ncbi:MAG: carbamate kinase [Candidatus Bathyarchaeota archaeon]|nr:carbamate kinase [Candidatus Bathyarchaeota archaeon]